MDCPFNKFVLYNNIKERHLRKNKFQNCKVVVTCRCESWRKKVLTFKKRVISHPSLCAFTKTIDFFFLIHFKTFTVKIMTSQGSSFWEGILARHSGVSSFNDVPSREIFLYLEVQSVLNLFQLSHWLDENITLFYIPSYCNPPYWRRCFKCFFFSVSKQLR